MELPIALQGSQFLLAALLGLIYGLCYDLLRGLRRNAKPLTHPSDLIFGLLCLLGNLLFAFYIGQGEYRIFMLPATALGASVYFLCLSRFLLPVFRLLWHCILFPFRKTGEIIGKIVKKSIEFSKKLFSFEKKSVTIKRHRKKLKNQRQEGSDRASAQIIPDHDARSSGAAGILHHHRNYSPTQN